MRWAGRGPIYSSPTSCRLTWWSPRCCALRRRLAGDARPGSHDLSLPPGVVDPKGRTAGLGAHLGSLPNFDPQRDSFPGLLLQKSGSGLTESDSSKYQIWVSSNGGLQIQGQVSFRFWSAMKDFNDDKGGVVEAFLLDCTPGGTNCDLIDQGSAAVSPWSSSQTWVARTIDFGFVDHMIPANRSLALKIVVGNGSGDDMWFAYDTTSYPSVSLSTPRIQPPPRAQPRPQRAPPLRPPRARQALN